MHEVDRCIGFEQVTPGTLTRVRFAGHQQHTQFVAHAVDRNHRAVVHLRELALERRSLYLDDIWPGMRACGGELGDCGAHVGNR